MAPLHILLFFMLGSAIGVFVHELGHLLFGALAGFSIRQVIIGSGEIVHAARIGETTVELRLFWRSGRVVAYPAMIWRRSNNLVFTLGGVVANLALAIVLLAPPRSSAWPDWVMDAIWGMAWAQIWLVVCNLTPRTFRDGLKNDGAQILDLLTRARTAFGQTPEHADYVASLRPYSTQSEPAYRPSKASARIAYNLARYRSDATAETDRLEACEALLRHLARGRLHRAEEARMLDSMITKQVVDGTGALHAKLNALSLRAVELAPNLATLRGTRRAALVEIGRYEDGRAMLAPLIEGPPSFDRILSTLFFARATFRLGDRGEAVRLLASARAMLCFFSSRDAARLFARVEAEIAASVDVS